MKKIRTLAVVVAVLFSASMFTGCGMYSYTPSTVSTTYLNPQWAPPYYAGARYYYLPDIECYYDLSTSEFIYLSDGRWSYSRNLPPLYMNYDLDNCFSIVLDVNVYRPWMHHQYYVSHYPRFYYRDYYDHSNIPYVRGYNENRRGAIYWGENERHRARSWDDRNVKDDRRFKYQKEDRMKQKEANTRDNGKPNSREDKYDSRNQQRPDRNNDKSTGTTGTDSRTRVNTRPNGTENTTPRQSGTTPTTDRTQNTNYYGKTIGNPVKVEKQMQERNERKSSDTKSRKSSDTKSATRK